MDTYLVINLPSIWSPVYSQNNPKIGIPYEFKWIENIGTMIIEELSVVCGGETLQKVSGQYLTALVQRDFDDDKKDLYNNMTGNTSQFNNPAQHENNNGFYPNARPISSERGGAQPSIIGKKLYIPINLWFTLSSKLAFPLVSLQYNELKINITLRPVREWFTIKNISNTYLLGSLVDEIIDDNICQNLTRIQPNFTIPEQQFYTFLQTPPYIREGKITVDPSLYSSRRVDWNADVHLVSTYGFLSDNERNCFAKNPQTYLIRQVQEYTFNNIVDSKTVNLDSMGMVASWTFFFRRSDANLRNEWTNYSNWSYNNSPLILKPEGLINKNIKFTGEYNSCYNKYILQTLGILLDGQFRENVFDAGIYNYIEKYLSIDGNPPEGLYFYNFGIEGSVFDFQPSGGINMSKFSNVQFEISTTIPPLNENAQVLQICDPETQELIGINKTNWNIYSYTYDLIIFEERYNLLKFESGNCGLAFAR